MLSRWPAIHIILLCGIRKFSALAKLFIFIIIIVIVYTPWLLLLFVVTWMFTYYGSVAHWVGVCVCSALMLLLMLLLLCMCNVCIFFVWVCVCVSCTVLVYLPLIWYALFTFKTNIWYFVTVHSFSFSLSLEVDFGWMRCAKLPPFGLFLDWW